MKGRTNSAAVNYVIQENSLTIVFYDWDDVTIIGTKAIPKVTNSEKQIRLIREAMDEMAAELRHTTDKGGPVDDETVFYSDNRDYPLTYKKGYSFGKWIEHDAKDENGDLYYTIYGYAVALMDAYSVQKLPEPPSIDLHNISYSELIIVKAVFTTNADMEPLNNVAVAEYRKRNYTLTVESYMQIDYADNFYITLKIKRENVDGLGVHRIRIPILRTNAVVGDVEMPNRYILLPNDIEVVEIVANRNITRINIVMNDGAEKDWIGSSVPRSSTIIIPSAGSDGFILLGAIGFINNLCRQAKEAEDTAISIANNTTTSGVQTRLFPTHFDNATLDYATVYRPEGYPTLTTPVVWRRSALANIYQTYLNAGRDLIQTEMQQAITYGPFTPGEVE